MLAIGARAVTFQAHPEMPPMLAHEKARPVPMVRADYSRNAMIAAVIRVDENRG